MAKIYTRPFVRANEENGIFLYSENMTLLFIFYLFHIIYILGPKINF